MEAEHQLQASRVEQEKRMLLLKNVQDAISVLEKQKRRACTGNGDSVKESSSDGRTGAGWTNRLLEQWRELKLHLVQQRFLSILRMT